VRLLRLCSFIVCVVLSFAAAGQEGVVRDDFSAPTSPLFSPLEGVALDFSGEPESQELPVLQPDFVAPPLIEHGFQADSVQEIPVREAILRLDAHLSPQSQPLISGLVWRVFGSEIDFDNKLPLIDTKQGGAAEFRLNEGVYFVHVAFGRVELSKKIELQAGRTHYENIALDAGGVVLDVGVQTSDSEQDTILINKNRVRFAIYQQEDERAGQTLIVEDVRPERAVRLKSGSYHIISTYGDANAIASADVRVEAGKLTEVTIEHQAAQLTLKLVREAGGEALADTSWVIMNDSGDTVREIANPHVDIVLMEGDYIAYARHKDQSYAREFSVVAGHDLEIDLLMGRDGVDENAG